MNKKTNKNNLNFTYRIYKNGRLASKLTTHKLNRFTPRIKAINFKDGKIKVYLRVHYGRHLDVHGKMSAFINEGIYENKKDLIQAFLAFREN